MLFCTDAVTRRQTGDGCSLAARRDAFKRDSEATKMRQVLHRQHAEKQVAEAAEANELLELYSLGIRGILADQKGKDPFDARHAAHRATDRAARGASDRPASASTPATTRSPIQTRSRAVSIVDPEEAARAQHEAAKRATASARTSDASNSRANDLSWVSPAPQRDTDLTWVTTSPLSMMPPPR